jgi:hypothetical protein
VKTETLFSVNIFGAELKLKRNYGKIKNKYKERRERV